MHFRKKPDQKGMALAIVIIIILALVCLAAWYVVANNKDSKGQPTSTNKTPPKQRASVDQFQFKEFKIQMALPEDLEGLAYKAEESFENDGEKGTALYLSTPRLNAAYEKCYGKKVPAERPLDFGAITKLKGKYSAPTESELPKSPLLKQFNDFHVLGSSPNGLTSCTAPGVDASLMQKTASDLNTSFLNAFKQTAVEVE